jgi:hypothetical protein
LTSASAAAAPVNTKMETGAPTATGAVQSRGDTRT